MKEEHIRKMSEILKQAQYLHGSLRDEKEINLSSERIEDIINRYNELINASKVSLSKILKLNSWIGPNGNSKFAKRVDIIGALSEIVGGLESLPELKKDQVGQSSDIIKLLNLSRSKLRKVIREKPKNEREVQDAFEAVVIGADIPYSRENDSIEYSSKTYIPDFTFQALDVALEIKLCGKDGREKQIIAEINDDILAYKTKYQNLIFVVYDTGFIRDVDLFTSSFENQKNVIVQVIKH